ncbi:MAG: T9SS type A sorting domain-containing protein [Flavobacteriaceae bacterium]|nr:T9SS type A sorting domain-containing protein [Flavobacteriaceae bacterium]
MKLQFLIFSVFFVQIFTAQTNQDCDHLITSSNQNFPNSANQTICLVGDFNYNSNIVLKNNAQLYVGEGVTINGNISAQNWNASVTIVNYGNISSNGNIDDNMVNSTIYNHGVFDRNINFNQGGNKEFHNYGEFTTNSSTLSNGTLINYSQGVLNLESSTAVNSNFNFENQNIINVNGVFALNKHGQAISGEINTSQFISNNGVILDEATVNSTGTPTFNGTCMINNSYVATDNDFIVNNSVAIEGSCFSVEGNVVLNGLNFFQETTLNAQGAITVNNGIRMNNSSLEANTSTTLNGTIRLTNSMISTAQHLTMNNLVQTESNNDCSSLVYSSINDWHGQMQSNFGDLKISQFANSYNNSNIQGNVSEGQCDFNFSNDCGYDGNDAENESVFIWEGNQNFKWDNSSNWNKNQVPSATDQVIISNSTNKYPKLEFDVEVGDFIFEENAILNLNDYQLTVNGKISGNGKFKSTDTSSLVINGEGVSELHFDEHANSIYDLTILHPNAQVHLESELNLYHILSLEAGELHTNDLLTFECTFANSGPFSEVITTAQVDQLNGEIIGDVTVVQCYSGRRAFRLVASTVDTDSSIRENWQEDAAAWNDNPNPGYGTHITGTGITSANPGGIDGLNGFDWQPSGNPSMFTFDNLNSSWNPIEGTNGNLEVGKPYRMMIRGNRATNITSNAAQPSQTKLRAKGKLHKGEFVLHVGNLERDSFVFFANPFQSDVDMSQVISASDNVRPYFYIWDTSLNARGSFAVIDATLPDNLAPEDSNISRFSLPQQAGFLLASGEGDVVIRFKEEHKTPFMKELTVFSDFSQPRVNVRLFNNELSEERSSDGLRINFYENFVETDFENAQKNENIDENIALVAGNELLAIGNEALPQDGDVLQLYTNKYQANQYSLKIDVLELDAYNVYLKDNYTNAKHALTAGENEIEFSVDANINASIAFNRFQLEFETSTFNVDQFTSSDYSVYPNPVNGSFVYVKNKTLIQQEATLMLYNMQGKKVLQSNQKFDEAGELKLDLSQISQGVYLLKSQIGEQTQTFKIIKE